jgi:hypothetical protein
VEEEDPVGQRTDVPKNAKLLEEKETREKLLVN